MQSISGQGVVGPLCDWLTISTPTDEAGPLRADTELALYGLGAFRNPGAGFYFAGDPGGSVGVYERNGVHIWSFSGKALETIRQAGGMHTVLGAIGAHPHRVTRLDVALDTCEDAPEVVAAMERRGHAGDVRLSRKTISPSKVTWTRNIGPCGRHTGTVYLGQRKSAEIMARVYDKRNEVWCRTGTDPGAFWTRYELELKCDGLTLRDADDPRALFWHYGGGDLAGIERPSDVGPWVAHGEGFKLPPRPEWPVHAMLKGRIDRSGELETWMRLADELGEKGRETLLTLLRQRLGEPAPS